MTSLTSTQISFLSSQGIPVSLLYDAGGMKRRHYQAAMYVHEKLFAYGVRECVNGHESIRTRKGHCIQCDTARIAFMMRAYKEAYVYLAGSQRAKVIKVGFSESPWNRAEHLNRIGYGRLYDWQILYYGKFKNAGNVEFATHQNLAKFVSPRAYEREGYSVDCREIFKCGYTTAHNALKAASEKPRSDWVSPNAVSKYDFDRMPPLKAGTVP